MSKDNIKPFRKSIKRQNGETTSLQQVIELMHAWRSQKKNRSEKIPDRIWDKIFALIERLPKSQVLVALRIGEAQLQSKLMERQLPHQDKSGVPLSTQENEEDIEFCEVSQEYPLAYKPAKAFDTTTSVVELYRPDGMLMKIHICTDSFEELLRAFFKG